MPGPREGLRDGSTLHGLCPPEAGLCCPVPGTVISHLDARLLDTLGEQGWTPSLPPPGYLAWRENPHFSASASPSAKAERSGFFTEFLEKSN